MQIYKNKLTIYLLKLYFQRKNTKTIRDHVLRLFRHSDDYSYSEKQAVLKHYLNKG